MSRIQRAFTAFAVSLQLLSGCSREASTSQPQVGLHPVGGCDDPTRLVDIVFVHGVDGHYRETWHPHGQPDSYWPQWLADDFKGKVGVWSFHYPASTSSWRGETMNLSDRAGNVLGQLKANRFDLDPDRALVFICHSFGGLVVKQLLESAAESPDKAYQQIFARTRGVVFIATPNSGSNLAQFLTFASRQIKGTGATVTVSELARNEPGLLDLNRWYRFHAPQAGIATMALCEEQRIHGILVVDKDSADPDIADIEPITVDGDHLTICKPESKSALVYLSVVRFIEELLERPPPPTFPDMKPFEAEAPSEEVNRAVEGSGITRPVLRFANKSGRRIKIALYDWTRHYAGENGAWRLLVPPVTGAIDKFEDFPGRCSGWYSVCVVRPDNSVTPPLLTRNLFLVQKPFLQVSREANDFAASFTWDN